MGHNGVIRFGWLLLLCLFSGRQNTAQPPAADKLVEVEDITVKGTHLPSSSVIRLAGIKPQDKVNSSIVNVACHNITATGLVKNIDYAYDLYPDRPGVSLELTVTDESPLSPATIKPAVDENALWSALQKADPIFMRELPPTENALTFYSKELEKCLHGMGRDNEYAVPSVTSDPSGKLVAIVFEIRRYKSLPSGK